MPLPAAGPPRLIARDAAYEQIRDWITLGPLEPEEPIRDTEIAAVLGVSRTPVREALLRLAQDGLVETFPGRGTRVAPLRYDRARHLFAVGGVLDALAAEQAAPKMRPDHLDAMAGILGEMAAHPLDAHELQLLDERFHAVYYEVAGNHPLVELLGTITIELRLFDRVGFRDPEIIRAAKSEHEQILAALRDGDGERAAAAARFNWTHSWAQIEVVLRRRGIEFKEGDES